MLGVANIVRIWLAHGATLLVLKLDGNPLLCDRLSLKSSLSFIVDFHCLLVVLDRKTGIFMFKVFRIEWISIWVLLIVRIRAVTAQSHLPNVCIVLVLVSKKPINAVRLWINDTFYIARCALRRLALAQVKYETATNSKKYHFIKKNCSVVWIMLVHKRSQ